MGKAMLLIALGLSSVMGRMLYNINARALDLMESSFERHTRMIARNSAYTAANISISELYRDLTWRTGIDTTGYGDALFTATAVDVTIDTPLAISRVRITAVGTYDGVSDTVSAIVAQPAFSYYNVFSVTWPNGEFWNTGDTLYGPIHCNDRWNLKNTPVFFGKVTSVNQNYLDPGGATPQFHGGQDRGLNAITLPATATDFIDSANAGGDVYSSELFLRFNSDGSYDYGNDTSYSVGTKYLSSYNGTIMTTGTNHIHVKGTVHGQVTVYSGSNIYIEDDIVYSQNPLTSPGSQDVLGLIAEDNIIVVDNVPNSTNCVIHAALMAMNVSFEVENYNSGSPRGNLTVVGSVIQRNRGNIGDYSGSTLVHGFEPVWRYDRRYLTVGPPYFPLIGRAVVLSWSE